MPARIPLCLVDLLIAPTAGEARPIDIDPRADAVTEWHVNAVNALAGAASAGVADGLDLQLAMVQGAVNSIDERYEAYVVRAARVGDGRGGAQGFPAPATPRDPWPKGQWRPFRRSLPPTARRRPP